MVFAFDFVSTTACNTVAIDITEKRPFIQAGYTSDDNLPRMALAGEFAGDRRVRAHPAGEEGDRHRGRRRPRGGRSPIPWRCRSHPGIAAEPPAHPRSRPQQNKGRGIEGAGLAAGRGVRTEEPDALGAGSEHDGSLHRSTSARSSDATSRHSCPWRWPRTSARSGTSPRRRRSPAMRGAPPAWWRARRACWRACPSPSGWPPSSSCSSIGGHCKADGDRLEPGDRSWRGWPGPCDRCWPWNGRC